MIRTNSHRSSLPFGAYYGSFVIRFIRKWRGRRFDFNAGETWVLHERQFSKAKSGESIEIDCFEVRPGDYELVAHYPKKRKDD